jgi:hypothetical protein
MSASAPFERRSSYALFKANPVPKRAKPNWLKILQTIFTHRAGEVATGKARQRAGDILDQLDELRHGLLMGTLNRRQLENLARMVRARRGSVTDPRLAEVLDQIELRAEIELAKYATLD